ncbi:hypothetical protein E0485_17030 [Paenibacillus albiflavus]|uniref:Cell-wall binding lipoprotein n=1 Tax=Paenibacillus albiflavus TaxID=2545760 RepID=A0A4R4E768_9BACL|nr:YkyA family protein [Paenibacillus albiflavus]TCZ75594.1 hypothetical protein E0485_17030 [Paenibacillus albiflavus]
MMKRVNISVALLLLSLAILGGCSDKAKDNAVTLLNEHMVLEQKFSGYLKQITQLETKDKQTYDNILTEGKKDYLNAKSSISDALQTIEERRSVLAEAQNALLAASENMNSLEKEVNRIKSIEESEQGHKLIDLYKSRDEVFINLYNQYMSGLELDDKLYQMLNDKSSNLKQINNQVAERNRSFTEVTKLMHEFNQKSQEFQDGRISFLKQLGV